MTACPPLAFFFYSVANCLAAYRIRQKATTMRRIAAPDAILIHRKSKGRKAKDNAEDDREKDTVFSLGCQYGEAAAGAASKASTRIMPTTLIRTTTVIAVKTRSMYSIIAVLSPIIAANSSSNR